MLGVACLIIVLAVIYAIAAVAMAIAWLIDVITLVIDTIDFLDWTGVVASHHYDNVAAWAGDITGFAWGMFQHGGLIGQPTVGILGEAGREIVMNADQWFGVREEGLGGKNLEYEIQEQTRVLERMDRKMTINKRVRMKYR